MPVHRGTIAEKLITAGKMELILLRENIEKSQPGFAYSYDGW